VILFLMIVLLLFLQKQNRLVDVKEYKNSYPLTTLSAHFTNNLHLCHIPIFLQYCSSYPYVCHDPYLPSIPASLQTLGRVECVVAGAPAPLDRGSSVLFSLPYFLSVFWCMQKIDPEDFLLFSHHCSDLVRAYLS
jgi:hypothetical protein